MGFLVGAERLVVDNALLDVGVGEVVRGVVGVRVECQTTVAEGRSEEEAGRRVLEIGTFQENG